MNLPALRKCAQKLFSTPEASRSGFYDITSSPIIEHTLKLGSAISRNSPQIYQSKGQDVISEININHSKNIFIDINRAEKDFIIAHNGNGHGSAIWRKENSEVWLLDTTQYYKAHKSLHKAETYYRIPEIYTETGKLLSVQSDFISCRMIAGKTLKRLSKIDRHTGKPYKELSYSNQLTRSCYPHPMVFAFSQSDQFLAYYVKKFIGDMPDKKLSEFNVTSKKELQGQILKDLKEYRKGHCGKNRVLYYDFKAEYMSRASEEGRQQKFLERLQRQYEKDIQA